jgi:hypothetical protein
VPLRIEDLIEPSLRAQTILAFFRRLGLSVEDDPPSSLGDSYGTEDETAGVHDSRDSSDSSSSGSNRGIVSSKTNDGRGKENDGGGSSGGGGSSKQKTHTSVMSLQDAEALGKTVFSGGGSGGDNKGGAARSLRSHFSLERWGGCPEAVVDAVEKAGLAGLERFGYVPWRELLRLRIKEEEEEEEQHQQELQGEEGSDAMQVGAEPEVKDRGNFSSSSFSSASSQALFGRFGCSVGSVQIQVPKGNKQPKKRRSSGQ